MPYEVVSNLAQTTMNNGGTMSTGATTVTVTSAAAFPATGNFRILIGSELMLVTGVSGNVFTVTRNIEGTTVASHVDGLTVTHCLTAAGLTQLMADRHLTGAASSLPSAGVAGREYVCTDSPFVYYDDGSAWHKYFGTYPITEVPTSSWTGDNMTGTTFTNSGGILNLTGSPGSGSSWQYQAAPSTPWSIRTAVMWGINPPSGAMFEFGFRDSSGKYLAFWNVISSNALYTYISDWTSASSSPSGSLFNANCWFTQGGLMFYKIQDDGTNVNFYVSQDGVNYAKCYSQSRTSFISAPTGVAIGIGGGTTSTVSFIDWTQGT